MILLRRNMHAGLPAANRSPAATTRAGRRRRLSAWIAPIIFLSTAVTLAQTQESPLGADSSLDPIMQPTKLGMRMTPDLAREVAKVYLRREVGEDLMFSETQEQRLSEAMARRIMELAHSNALKGRDFCEFAYESMLRSRARFTPELSREFAQRAVPFVPLAREFLKNAVQDARPILTPEQIRLFDQRLAEKHKELDRFEARMKRWSEGGAAEGENPFADLKYDSPATQATPAQMRGLIGARRRAERHVRDLGPAEWAKFLRDTRSFFAFTPEQSAQAAGYLDQARRQAFTVMTDEWRDRVFSNRLTYFACQALPDRGLGPYLYQLDQEYAQALAPLDQIGGDFRGRVMGLVTPEQREAVLVRLSRFAAEQGLAFDPATDASWLPAASQPAP